VGSRFTSAGVIESVLFASAVMSASSPRDRGGDRPRLAGRSLVIFVGLRLEEARVGYAEVNGQRLFFQDTGGDGPPVVFSHGFLMDHEMFWPQVEALRDTHRVITWDARGFGRTEFDGEPFTYWDSARDMFGLLDHLGISRAVLAGMSQGGYLSLRASLLAPDRVRGLVLIDTQAPPEADDKVAEYRMLVEAWVENGYQQELAEYVSGLIIGDPEEEPRWWEKWGRWDPENLEPASMALLDRDDISDRVEEIEAPTLLIHGENDTAIPVDRCHQLAQALPDATGPVVVEGAAHAPNLSHPQPVNAALRDFLRGLPA
jgi:3-oxoadipate enol-lactonase